ncbi:MAG: hypothetical protein PHV78_01585 [Patescibacteria group bacterium]|nr:hypothetical protein [Patescibacteria group bacterium]MDD5121157.1 hypothetical protein [Patescibacteria group bacterium]MDD5221672.1 hypothetical protein [Patescibacteria group bacterium]MDD5395924.1 hypothetical protein [Patescibacteria group bacterium]
MSDGANVVECLARTTPLSSAEWAALVEARRRLFSRVVAKWRTLPSIGDQKGLYVEGHPSPINGGLLRSRIVYVFGELGSTTVSETGEAQGVFEHIGHELPKRRVNEDLPLPSDLDPDIIGTLRYWALMRNGAWALITVFYVTGYGYKNRGKDIAFRVVIQHCAFDELLKEAKIHPRQIWWRLRIAFAEAINATRRRAQVAEELARRIMAEDELLRVSPGENEAAPTDALRHFVRELDNPSNDD